MGSNDIENHTFNLENEIVNKEDGLASAADINHSELLLDNSFLENSTLAKQSDVLIITNLSDCIFNEPAKKKIFEELVLQIEPEATFTYLSSFRRTRVQTTCETNALNCIQYLHNFRLYDRIIKCYLAPVLTNQSQTQYLELPEQTNLFFLSPPSSPPIGWEPQSEKEPTVNHELLAAIEKLGKCDSYELYKGPGELPSIVIHMCEDPPNYARHPPITHTRCPQRHKV